MKNLRWVTYLLIITILISIKPGQAFAQNKFTDVPAGKDYFEHVNYIAGLGIISGYPNGTFKPSNHITRAQAAKMLIKATKNENTNIGNLVIKGPSAGEQYNYMSKAVALGYFKTDQNGFIESNEPIKRDEMGYALAVAFKLTQNIKDKPLLMPDVQNHPFHDKTFADKINGLYYAGITEGDNGLFLPNKLLTRAQFARFIARALNDDFKVHVKQPDQTSKTSFVKVNTVNTTLNVRQQPSASSSSAVIGKLAHGTIVEVVGTTGDWLQIIYYGKTAYISSNYTVPTTEEAPETSPPVTPENPVTPPPASTGKLLGKVTASSLNVRSGAGTSSPIVAKVTLGQKVEVLELNGNWAKVKTGSTTGYVSKIYLKLLNQSGGPLKDRIIVLDAGHGGKDPGASSKGLTEKSVTLKVTKLVEAKLKKAGAKVLMTRSNDTYLTLKQRTDFAKNNFAETFVSVHINAATSSAKGAEVWIDTSTNPNGTESRTLANLIQKNIVKDAKMVDRRVNDKQFYVVRYNNVAAILVELGFVTNADDFKKLSDDKFLEIYAEAIYKGLVQYYSMD